MRVFELAKELGANSKGLVTLCKDMGEPVKSHMSVISEELWYKLQDRMKVAEDKRIPYEKKAPKKKAAAKKSSVTSKTRKKVKDEKGEKDEDEVVVEPPVEKKVEQEKKKPARATKAKKVKSDKSKSSDSSKTKMESVREDKVTAKAPDTGLIKKVSALTQTHFDETIDKKVDNIEEIRQRAQDRQEVQREPFATGGLVRSSRISNRQALQNRVASRRGRRRKVKGEMVTVDKLHVNLPITLRELSSDLHVKVNDMINRLKHADGIIVEVDEEITSEDIIIAIGIHFGVDISVSTTQDQETQLLESKIEQAHSEEDDLKAEARPPVVAVLGHVDHGKTSLLDYIRSSRVAAREAGGITQHIGAYQIEHKKKPITFIDTPGHQVFTEMRARGAQCTDVVILVVAADDGVMPQTEESIQHARAAKVPIIVAVNKMDVAGANIEKVKQELSRFELISEDWGGQTIICPVSAATGEGIEHLLEMILLQTEIMELKANPQLKSARGVVLESTLSKQKGVVATLLVQNGTLKKGDIVVCGSTHGKVRALVNENNEQLTEALPSRPVQVIGLEQAPDVASTFQVMPDMAKAREVAALREDKTIRSERPDAISEDSLDLDDIFDSLDADQNEELSLIIKADVKGSLEALVGAIEGMTTSKVPLNILAKSVGGITESDIILAKASSAQILGFSVVADANARKAAKANKVDVKLYRVIYELLDDLKATMEGRVASEQREDEIGQAQVRAVFSSSKFGKICGCIVTDGIVRRGAGVRVSRNGVVIHNGQVDSLRRFKEDAKEVKEGFECGIRVKDYDDIKPDDSIHFFEVVEVAGILE